MLPFACLFSTQAGELLYELRVIKESNRVGRKDIGYNILLTEKEIGFYLLQRRSQILLLNGLKYIYLIRCSPKWKSSLIPGPQQICNNIFHRISNWVALNFYYNFDGLFSGLFFDLAIWIKYICLSTEILMWEVELFIYDINFMEVIYKVAKVY